MIDPRHATVRIVKPSQWGKSFFLYSSVLPQSTQACRSSPLWPKCNGLTWSHLGHCHSPGPAKSYRAGCSHTGHAKRTFTTMRRLFLIEQIIVEEHLTH